MTQDPQTYTPVVKLTTAELERFQKNAPAALAVRGTGFVLEQLACSGETVLTGSLPLVGVLAYGWSPAAMAVFLLAGVWTAIVCDCLKYAVLRAAVARETRELEDHRRVWLVVDMLRKKQVHRDAIKEHRPYAGLLADVAAGSVATAGLVGLLEPSPQTPGLPYQDLGFVLSLLGFIAYELALTVWIVLHHRLGSGCKRPVRIEAGWRGIGLLLLMTLALMIVHPNGALREDQLPTLSAMAIVLIANGWFILLGVLYGLNLVHELRATAWLRAYLQRRRGGRHRRKRRRK